jgi:hypothetical protein
MINRRPIVAIAAVIASITALAAQRADGSTHGVPAAPTAAAPGDLATTTRVSVNSTGRPAGNGVDEADISDDGRLVAFATRAALDPADTNSAGDFYVHDRATLRTVRVSTALDGKQLPRGPGGWPGLISGGGGAFAYAIDRGTGQLARETVVRDLRTGSVQVASVLPSGSISPDDAVPLSVSDDGNLVLFRVYKFEAPSQVFVRDRRAGSTVEVDPGAVRLSGDGRSLLIETTSPLDLADTNGVEDVYVQPLAGGQAVLASLADDGPSFCGILGSDLSDNAQTVVWIGCGSGQSEVWVRDLAAQRSVLVTHPLNGLVNGSIGFPRISGDGTHAVFTAEASNLVPGDTNNMQDVFLADLAAATLSRANITWTGQQQTRVNRQEIPGSYDPTVDDSGNVVAFWAYGGWLLVPGDSGHVGGTFVRDLTTHAADRPRLLAVLGSGNSLSASWQAPTTPTGPIGRYRLSPLAGDNVLQPFDATPSTRFTTHSGYRASTVYRFWLQALMPTGLGPYSTVAYVPVVSAPSSVPARTLVSLAVVAGPWLAGTRAQLWRRAAGTTTWQYVQSAALATDGRAMLRGYATTSVQWEVRIKPVGAPTGARRVNTSTS